MLYGKHLNCTDSILVNSTHNVLSLRNAVIIIIIIILIILVSHIDIFNENYVLEEWCLKEYSEHNNVLYNLRRINYGSFLELYDLALNSSFPYVLFQFLLLLLLLWLLLLFVGLFVCLFAFVDIRVSEIRYYLTGVLLPSRYVTVYPLSIF